IIVSEYSCQVAVNLNSLGPILLRPRAQLVLLRRQCGIERQWRRGCLADVIGDLAAITEGIQCRDDRLAVRTFPDADVEGNTDRSFLRGIRATNMRRGLPSG